MPTPTPTPFALTLVAAAPALRHRITTLDLRFNAIGDGGAVAIAAALEGNAALTHLDLSRNALRELPGDLQRSERIPHFLPCSSCHALQKPRCGLIF